MNHTYRIRGPVLPVLLATALLGLPAVAADQVRVAAGSLKATFEAGTLTDWDAGGRTLVEPGGANLCGILRVGRDHWVVPAAGADEATVTPGQAVQRTYRDLAELPGSVLTHEYSLVGDDLVITQKATSPGPGVHGVQWGIGSIPLRCHILVPAHGGIRLTADSPGTFQQFDYPISWEAQFVVIEDQRQGLCVWADDAAGRYKRLTVRRTPKGWQLGFVTHTSAPFAERKECTSVPWHLSAYRGDWRVPARRYRDWTAKTWALTPRAAQTPAWAKDTRFLVIMGQEVPVLEALAKRVDPTQTLLYIPGWRQHGYDRMYPDYTANETFPAFVDKAHELGFRVMPHVNYFGCDPMSPEYATFEKYQVRNPWNHEREWWLWERADPVIKFAYISPACKAWRELQISRWKELVERYKVDALHLDQTLCIFNDDNGLIDGMTMLEGNVALHRELRQALPGVAISGEGLDEVTMRFEAFAQRHSYGLDFVEGTWDRPRLAMAHPISAYVLNGFTQPYGYLGMTSPANGQLYAAWRENYRKWGVIPTFPWPSTSLLAEPEGFAAQCLAEAEAFTRHRLDADLDGAWPQKVRFSYRGAGGVQAAYEAAMQGWVFTLKPAAGGEEEVSRIVTATAKVDGPGSILGWRYYNEEAILGLDPEVWYAYSAVPRDQAAFHVRSLPPGFTTTRVTQADSLAVIEVADVGGTTRIAGLLDKATCGSRPFAWDATQARGPLTESADGAIFMPQGQDIHAHPPWKAQRTNPQTGVVEAGGTGIAFASIPVSVPEVQGTVWFRSEVAMDKGAVGEGKTDGVVYRVRASAPAAPALPEVQAEVLNATATRATLDLDLTAFRGRDVRLVMEVDPGPKRSATFDWARWYQPRVEVARRQRGTVGIVSPPFSYALCSSGDAKTEAAAGRMAVTMDLPGSVILLREEPKPVALPLDLAATPFILTFTSASGQLLTKPQYASAVAGENTVGGAQRAGLSTHPPDHGLTTLDYPMVLPAGTVRLRCFVGLRDGSKSEGCGFVARVNGIEVARQSKLPGEWSEMTADLSPWAGKAILLSLVTDSEGGYNFDWAVWGDVRLTAE